MTIDPTKTYTATITTTCGDIDVTLDAKNAPKSVNNFVFLAKQGFYDGLTFHRVAKDFVIQGGDPKGDRHRRPGLRHVADRAPEGRLPARHARVREDRNSPARTRRVRSSSS